MRIKSVSVNNRKKGFEIGTVKGDLFFPFSKLRLVPSEMDWVKTVYVDKELGLQGITYVLESGAEDSLMVDAFLEYNGDPEYFRKLFLHNLTVRVLRLVEESGLSKREIARKLCTSPAQLYRLLDTANYKKTTDQLFKILVVLGYDLEGMLDYISVDKVA